MYSKSFRKNLPNVNIYYMIGMCKTWGTKTRNPQNANTSWSTMVAFCCHYVVSLLLQLTLSPLQLIRSAQRLWNYVPIGSMYAIYGNIYHQYTPNVSIYIPYMDPLGYCLVFLVPYTKSQLYPPQGIASAIPRPSCPFAQRPWHSNWVGKVWKNSKLPLGLWNFDFAGVHVLVVVVVGQPDQFRWYAIFSWLNHEDVRCPSVIIR